MIGDDHRVAGARFGGGDEMPHVGSLFSLLILSFVLTAK